MEMSSGELALLVLGWLLAGTALFGMWRLRQPAHPTVLADSLLRALGVIGAVSLPPALFAVLLGAVLPHDRPLCEVSFFPVAWFAFFGGGLALLIDSHPLFGLHPTGDSRFHTWMSTIAVLATCAILALSFCFSRSSQSRGIPTAAKTITWILVGNVIAGVFQVLLIVTND